MTFYVLTPPRDADALIARMFAHGRSCFVSVREERAFRENGWLGVGHIELDVGDHAPDRLFAAVRRGGFEWKLPELDDVSAKLSDLLGVAKQEKAAPKVRRALNAMAAISVRTGLHHPKFDPHALEAMPFRCISLDLT